MQIVMIDLDVYIDINGKTFKLLRCYEDDDRSYTFDPRLMQVTGKFTLMKEDLPNKDWRIIKSNVNGVMVYTIFDKKYAMFESQAENKKIMFFAASYEGAMLLAFTYLAHHYSLDVEPEDIKRATTKYLEDKVHGLHGLSKLTDRGNSGIHAVLVRFTSDGWNGFDNEDPDRFIECFEK